jgi:neutrophil factor 2
MEVHIGNHTRGMSILPTESYSDLVDDLYSKFPELHPKQYKSDQDEGIRIQFKDEDGDMLSMEDDGDFEAALDVAR